MQHCSLQEDFLYPLRVCLLNERKAPAAMAKSVQEHAQANVEVWTAVDGKASCVTACHVQDVVHVSWDNGQTAVAQVIFLCRAADTCLASVRVWAKSPSAICIALQERSS